MAEIVYLLCTLSSLFCAFLLGRGYRASRSRLLFWSAAAFACFAVNNIFLFLDLAVFPGRDLSMFRHLSNLTGVLLLLYGMIWEGL